MAFWNKKTKISLMVLAVVSLGSSLIVGCGKGKSSGGTTNNGYYCDSFGCYSTNPNNPFPNYNDPYYNNVNSAYGYYGDPKTTVEFSGQLGVENGKAYQELLDGMMGCHEKNWLYSYNHCRGISRSAPYIRIVVSDYKFSGSGGTSRGQVIMDSNTMSQSPIQVVWQKNASSQQPGFSTQFFLPNQRGSARQMKVSVAGQVNYSYVGVSLKFGSANVAAGQANLTRHP